MAGVWSGRNISADYIKLYAAESGIVWNNPVGFGGAVIPTFWYSMINQYFVLSTLDLLKLDPAHRIKSAAAVSWAQASQAMGGAFNHTGFNFSAMRPIDNGLWTEGDVAGGVAWLGVVAAQVLSGDAQNLALRMARVALSFLEAQIKSPLYECLMPLGALAAARMNAEHGGEYNVTRLLSWSLSDGNNQYRQGWGMLDAEWGPRGAQLDIGGLIGSITDGGGYAFAGNSLWFMAILVCTISFAGNGIVVTDTCASSFHVPF